MTTWLSAAALAPTTVLAVDAGISPTTHARQVVAHHNAVIR